jgi:hypothetical protein
MRGAVVALGALAALGCAADGAGPRSTDRGREPGTTTVLLENHVAPPYKLERVLLTVDGQRAALSTVPPSGAPASVAMRVRLAPGEHMLQIVASATRGDAATGDRQVTTIDTSQQFQVGPAPALVSVDMGRDLQAEFRMEGGQLAPRIGQPAPPPTEDQRCGKLALVPAAMCHVETVAFNARRDKDMVKLACASEKLSAMRTLATAIDDARESGGAFDAREVVRAAEQRVVALARDVDACASDEVMRATGE